MSQGFRIVIFIFVLITNVASVVNAWTSMDTFQGTLWVILFALAITLWQCLTVDWSHLSRLSLKLFSKLLRSSQMEITKKYDVVDVKHSDIERIVRKAIQEKTGRKVRGIVQFHTNAMSGGPCTIQAKAELEDKETLL